MTKPIETAAALFIAASQVLAQNGLETVFSSDLVINGPTVSPDGRLFTVAQPASPGTTPEVVEIRDGKKRAGVADSGATTSCTFQDS
jgi:hypothetical protein